jgi:hypothetical protein
MVRANETLRVPAFLAAYQRSAMAADIIERPNSPVFRADHHDRIGIHSQSEIIPRVGNLARVPGEKPSSAPNPREVEPIDFVVEIKFARQRRAGTAFGEEPFDPGAHTAVCAQSTTFHRNVHTALSVARMGSILHAVISGF